MWRRAFYCIIEGEKRGGFGERGLNVVVIGASRNVVVVGVVSWWWLNWVTWSW
jgi:hypothetical protein